MAAPPALIVDKPLRSGQQVYARGRDLVVLAMVNAGAEVIADGHIHVYAPLRGKAIAGARGNTEARIFALAMEPELVSIAGIYRTSEVPWPDEVLGKPTQVRLFSGPDGDKLVMDANAETDPAKRAAILQKVEAMLIDDAAYVPLHWEDLAYGAKKNVDIKPVVNVMNFPYLGDLVVNK